MLINERPLEAEPTFDFDRLAPKERIIFFDIETTGLSAAHSNIYLIGVVIYEDGRWLLRQFFSEGLYDEAKLLTGFFELLNERRKSGRIFLISFNGDGFDIPFIQRCLSQYGLGYDFRGTFSIDLFKHIKRYKKFAGLENCKLKTVERLCGIFREDKFNGGELIYVYEEYLRLSQLDEQSCEYNDNNLKLRDALLKSLLLHNAEDILDMPLIVDILGYDSLFDGGFEITESRTENGVWNISAVLDMPLPKGVYYEDEYRTVSISEEEKLSLNIAVNIYSGELKNFYKDYKEYYYLPGEDMAIHKSLGEFVDKKARKQATAKTCYQRVSGEFVPCTEEIFTDSFYREYKQKPIYGSLNAYRLGNDETGEKVFDIDREMTKKYIMAVLNSLL